MNLYIFNKSSYAAIFGIGTYVRELTKTLRNSEINVYMVNLKSEKTQIHIEEIDGIRHWYFPEPIQQEHLPKKSTKQDELYYRNVVYLLQLYIDDRKDLIFHLNSMDCKPLADALKIVFDCKIVLVVHYLHSVMPLLGSISRLSTIISQPDEPMESVETIAKRFYLREKELTHSVDKIICLSNHTFDLLRQDYDICQEKMVVIYNGLAKTSSVYYKPELFVKYNIQSIPVILFVGRVDNMKGITYALRAFKRVLDAMPCRLIIAGEGSFNVHMKECEDFCTYITWAGRVGKEQLYEFYSIADIGVLPSFTEQCNYVAIEMMMHGLPMVTTSAPGLAEMTEDGISSLQVPVIENDDTVEIDTELLAEKMLYLLQNSEERKRIGANARKRYELLYTSDIFRENMINFYQSLL